MQESGARIQYDNIADTFQHYKKWQQRRHEIQAKVKDKLNDSLTSFPEFGSSVPKSSHFKREKSGPALERSSKKTPSVKLQIQEVADRSEAGGRRGQEGYALSLRRITEAQMTVRGGKNKFDDLLQTCFSSLSRPLNQPLQEANPPSQRGVKDKIENLRSTWLGRSPSESKLPHQPSALSYPQRLDLPLQQAMQRITDGRRERSFHKERDPSKDSRSQGID